MPVYEYKCAAEHLFDRFLKLAQYQEPQTCECGQAAVKIIRTPSTLRPDIPAYTSPVDGRWVNSRAQRREDLKRNGCVEWDPDRESDQRRYREQADTTLESKLEETVEREITAMPLRKRETLAAELVGGAEAPIVRAAPH